MAVEINDGSLYWNAGIDLDNLRRQAEQATDILNNIQREAEKESKTVENLARKAAAGVAGYLSVTAASNFINQMVRVRGEFQQLEVALNTMLGSKERADKLLKEITEFAATTPFELKEVAGATKQLLAFGIAAEDIEKTLRMLGDVSAGIGAPLGEIAYLFGTIKTQGVALTQDVRQFAQRGIPIYEELAKVFKVSTEEVGNLISAGKVGFPEIQKAFESLTAEGSKFGGLMEAQSATIAGQLSNLQDAITNIFNELGKSNEGVISDVISGLSYIAENYQTILDILKVLIVAYGSYKAAILLTNAVQAAATALTKGYTVAELLRYNAMLLSEKAMKLLNATMLANPAAFVIAGIATLITTLTLFGKKSSEAKSKAELLANAQKNLGDRISETEAKIRPYLEQLKKANLTEQERLDIYKKLQAIDPKIVDGIDAKKLSYQNLTDKVNDYLAALRNQYKLEANKEALQESIKQERELEKKIAAVQKKVDAAKKQQSSYTYDPYGVRSFANSIDRDALDDLTKSLEEQKKISEELAGEQIETGNIVKKAELETIKVIDEKIKALKDAQSANSDNNKKFIEYQKQIDELEAKRRKITGATKKELSESSKLENDRNSILEKRLNLLQQIAEVERNANQTGLSEREKALDQINEKYDKQLQMIDEVNRDIERFNKKNPNSPVSLFGQSEKDRINAARNTELANQQYRQDADNFIKAIQAKEAIFEQFQELLEGGNHDLINKFKETYETDLENFSEYIDLLKSKIDELQEQQYSGNGNLFTARSIEELNRMLEEAQRAADERQKKQAQRNFDQLISESEAYYLKLSQINTKYDQQERTLIENRNKFSLEQYQQLQDDLARRRKEDIDKLNDDFAKGLPEFQKLFKGIDRLSDKAAKDLIRRVREMLAELVRQGRISQELADDLKDTLQEAEEQLTERNVQRLNDLSNIMGELAQVAGEFNNELKEALESLSKMVTATAQVMSGLKDFKAARENDDKVGQASAALGIAGAVVNYANGIIQGFRAVRESRKRAQAEVRAFQQQVLLGEIDVNMLYRERAIEQAKLNKLRLEGIKAETEALKKAKEENLKDFNRIFEQLQGESYITGLKTKKKRGSLLNGLIGYFSGTRTVVKQELESLAGKTYDDMEKLFMSGQLTEKAKELFMQLQKLKQEGLDIDKALEDAKEQAKQLFTGTTVESIADSIIEGFRQGKRSAADFADNFQELMQNAVLQALKFRALEGPLNDFFDRFAESAESDNALTSPEIEQLQRLYNSILENAATQFEQLQGIANLNFSPGELGTGKSLQGAIRGMTEQQAELLAGQFGGLRMTAADQLRVATEALRVMQNIETNTYRLHQLTEIVRRIEIDGLKVK